MQVDKDLYPLGCDKMKQEKQDVKHIKGDHYGKNQMGCECDRLYLA